ncbi:galactokinase [Nocardioides sp. zg-1228]|uniref:galactokinase n=1 Tax=Nocardioides sp. zg-1228 TaxID=2763008 RepID=UPI0016426BE8|nr:galactokinase [Nocardioides sp. zg-1228]MBC2932910.1 galactokinase [Nocardioides sp. zg-1228]QSF56886.1 galactokinase [Nocardioides sp. zg-1228]
MTAVWRAPGRINLVGEHTDYNDGFVLPFALEVGCTATVTAGASGDDGWRVRSAQEAQPVTVPRTGLGDAPEVPDWSRYVLGALWLLTDRGVDVPPLAIEVDSDVPTGAGLSSSAALVCSVARAVDDQLGLGLDDDALFALTRDVENDAVGAPTGGMDQLVSLRGQEGHALFCDMRSHDTRPVPLDLAGQGLAVLVADTRAPHRHSDGEYGARRRGCEEAARRLGVPALRDVAVGDLDDALARLDDAELRRYVRHVVTEDDRVLSVVRLLDDDRLADIGPLLTASHASMRDDFQITVPEVDTAVDALLDAGALGARMTGGGFGGCVIGLVPEPDVERAGDAVRAAFADAAFTEPALFTARPARGAHRLPGGVRGGALGS